MKPTLSHINWAGQVCEVLEETPSKFRIRFSNASGTCEMWLGKGANIHKVPESQLKVLS